MTDLEQIKERVDIVELIQGYVRLQKAGMNYKALCPFHNEKTPSFMVSPSRQIWHCFGCSLGGDVFKFLMQIEGLEFKEALQILAKRTGIELKHFNKESQSEKTKLYEISELAAKFFEKQLWESENGKKALEYLKSRGLKNETVKEWRLGWAPNTWNSLKSFLKEAGFEEKGIYAAGLSVKKDSGDSTAIPQRAASGSVESSTSYDRFRGRIMFPIADINSQVVGFTGRIFEEVTGEIEAGKYVNTPQTEIYDKSRIIYGLDKAKMEIRKKDKAIVVEGNMDVLMSHQAGVKNVVASSGTALTVQHLKVLKRYTQNLDLCFDQDLAGETAAKRGINLALADGLNVGVVSVTSKDPADLVKESPQKWVEASVKSQPIVQFYIAKAFDREDLKTAVGKKNIARDVLPIIKLIENKVEQAHWLDELSGRLKIEQKILVQAMVEMKTTSPARPHTTTSEGPDESQSDNRSFGVGARLALEETLLALLFKMPSKSKELNEGELEIFKDKLYNSVFERLKLGEPPHSFMSGGGELPHGQAVSTAIPQRAASGSAEPSTSYEDNLRLELVKFKSEQFFGDLEQKDLENEISRLIKSLKKELILEKIKDLEIKMKEAKNQEEVLPLLQEVQKFSSKLSSLN